MVARLGVGATTASAVIFSVLLVSNVVVFVAAQERGSHYAQGDAEDYFADEAHLLTGAGATNLLIGAQRVLSSTTFDCADAPGAAALEVGSLSDVQSFGGMTARTAPVGGVDLTAADNLSDVAPFNGASAGDFDILLTTSVAGREVAAGVSYNRTEGHLVHLPARLDGMSTLCAAALDALEMAVADSGTNCTVSAVAPIVQRVAQGFESEAASDGFSMGMAYSVSAGPSCTVSIVVSVVQSGIDGPGGEFSVRMEEEGAATFSPRGA